MKLLFITQRIDLNDDLLGFVHGWLQKLAPKLENITAIGLGVGEYNLPTNVQVFSLGKEAVDFQFFRKIKYVVNFYKYIWTLRKEYDLVFVHMNKEYAVLGGALWRLWSKNIFLWYNHQRGNFWSRLAFAIAHKIFYTSPFSFAAKFKKTHIMPAGIDTELFKKDHATQKKPNSILYLGRISPIKNIDVLIAAAKILSGRGVEYILDIVGDAPPKDSIYLAQLKDRASELLNINFYGKAPHYQVSQLYNQYEIVVNLTNSGSFDKSVLEAMACENLVVLSNLSFKNIVENKQIFQEKNQQDLSEKLISALNLPAMEKEEAGRQMRNYVLNHHSLDLLVEKLINNFKGLAHE